MSEFYEVCSICGEYFKTGQYVYQVKLDDGSLAYSHGFPCIDKVPIGKHRLPMRNGDWWIREMGMVKKFLDPNEVPARAAAYSLTHRENTEQLSNKSCAEQKEIETQ